MKELFLPEATNDSIFFVMTDTSAEALIQLGIIVVVVIAIVFAIVAYRKKKK